MQTLRTGIALLSALEIRPKYSICEIKNIKEQEKEKERREIKKTKTERGGVCVGEESAFVCFRCCVKLFLLSGLFLRSFVLSFFLSLSLLIAKYNKKKTSRACSRFFAVKEAADEAEATTTWTQTFDRVSEKKIIKSRLLTQYQVNPRTRRKSKVFGWP